MNCFVIGSSVEISMPKECINDTVQEIIYGLLYRSVQVKLIPRDEPSIMIGDGQAVPLNDNEGVISVCEKGIFINARDERALLNCLLLLLRRAIPESLEAEKEKILIPCGEECVSPEISRRMIHFCIVPNVPLSTYKKLFRLASVLGYTHIIVEFWGTLQYEAMKELHWKNYSFTKGEISELLKEAIDLKVAVVPMINHFGHASAARMYLGKHVVLDQNPRKATLFSPDGWRWSFEKNEVTELLRNMRKELYELFGKGEYFHIGFDEGFSYPSDDGSTNALCKYLKKLCEEIISEGRTPLLWGDQLLHEPTVGISMKTGYEGNAHTQEEAEKLLRCLPKEAVVCDWQYSTKDIPWISAGYFKERSVNFMVCPKDNSENIGSAIKTAKEYDCYGVLHTTWSRPFERDGVNSLFDAHDMFFNRKKETKKVGNKLADAALMRKIWFADGEYEKAGWGRTDFDNDFSI
jgi:hypothetical protein